MADAVLFEFLHTEMVAELWTPDPDPGSGVSAGGEGRRRGPRREDGVEASGCTEGASAAEFELPAPSCLRAGFGFWWVATVPASRVIARCERDDSGQST